MLQSVERCVEGAVTVLGEGSLKALCGSQMSHVRESGGRSVSEGRLVWKMAHYEIPF
jgi:hypothetical protein